jgi:hypothetical protein
VSVTSYTKAKIDSLLAGAVALSNATPLAPISGGFAGTANSAMRGDAQIPLAPQRPVALGFTTGVTVVMDILGSPASSTLNKLNLGPVYMMQPSRAPITCTVIGINVTTGGSAGATIRFGLWKSQANGLPDLTQRLFDSGELASTATGLKTFAYTTAIPEGLYWAGVVMHTAICSVATSSGGVMRVFDGTLTPGSGGSQHMRVDSVTSALPVVSTGLTIQGDYVPLMYFTVA